MTPAKPDEGLRLARTIVDLLDAKKGEDILLLDLIGVCSFTDYFVLCTGSSERTLQALADEVTEKVKKDHRIPGTHREGGAADGWILLDYGSVVVHLFSADLRRYYRLEELWRAGQVLVRMP
ncbi:MAG: ribosome silencing factor [Anaerolineales bacterium]